MAASLVAAGRRRRRCRRVSGRGQDGLGLGHLGDALAAVVERGRSARRSSCARRAAACASRARRPRARRGRSSSSTRSSTSSRPAGRLRKAQTAPTLSASAIITPPWSTPTVVHSSGRQASRAGHLVGRGRGQLDAEAGAERHHRHHARRGRGSWARRCRRSWPPLWPDRPPVHDLRGQGRRRRRLASSSDGPGARTVRLVLCGGDEVVGALEPFAVATPWWQDAAGVVEGARAITAWTSPCCASSRPNASGAARRGGRRTSARSSQPTARSLEPWPGDPLAEHPPAPDVGPPGRPGRRPRLGRRHPRRRRDARRGRGRQVRAWNLSSLWQLPIDGGVAWLKVVPPFFAHEGAVIGRSASARRCSPPTGRGCCSPTSPATTSTTPRRRSSGRWSTSSSSCRSGGPGGSTSCSARRAGLAGRRRSPSSSAPTLGGHGRRARAGAPWPPLEPLLDGLAERMARRRRVRHPGLDRPRRLPRRQRAPAPSDRVVVLDWGDSGVGHPAARPRPRPRRTSTRRAPRPSIAAWVAAWRDGRARQRSGPGGAPASHRSPRCARPSSTEASSTTSSRRSTPTTARPGAVDPPRRHWRPSRRSADDATATADVSRGAVTGT